MARPKAQRQRPARQRRHRAGYAIVGGNLVDLVQAGELTTFDLGLYARIRCDCDYAHGRWFGSAAALCALAPSDPSKRTVQRSLARLEKAQLIRPFRRPGRQEHYAVLINGFLVTAGQHKGQRLDAVGSRGWQNHELVFCQPKARE